MSPRLPDPARSRAVLIGASRYGDPKLPALPSVAANLADLSALLTCPDGTGLPAEHCTVLADPTRADAVGDCLYRVRTEAEDLFLVYYAGHGLVWENELCLALTNSRADTGGTSALKCADVRKYLRGSRARVRVLILDCCFAARSFDEGMAEPAAALLTAVDVAGAFILAAAQGIAYAPKDRRNTAFTGELLWLLRTGVAGEDRLLSLDLLYRHLAATMCRRGWPEPRCSGSDTAGQLALGRNWAFGCDRKLVEFRERLADLDAVHGAHPMMLADLGRAATRLAEEMAATEQTFELVRQKIAEPNLPRLDGWSDVPDRVTALAEIARDSGWTRLAGELAALERDIAAALAEVRRLHAAARGLLDRRDELRSRLRVVQVKAANLDIAEKDAAKKLYRRAHDLLWVQPCDIRAATGAVNAYLQWVATGSGGAR